MADRRGLRSRSSFLAATAGLAFASALVPVAATASQASWSLPPVVLTQAGIADGASVGIADDGTTIATWTRSLGAAYNVQVAVRRPGGDAFSSPVTLSDPGTNAISPSVAVAPDGTSVIVWYREGPPFDAIEAVIRAPDGTISGPMIVAEPVNGGHALRVAIDRDGTATVIWRAFDQGFLRVSGSTRPRGGGFSPPVGLSRPGHHADLPSLAVAPDGSTAMTWVEADGGVLAWAVTRDPPDGFTAAAPLGPVGIGGRSPRLSAGSGGTIAAAWVAASGPASQVKAVLRSPGEAFSAPVDVLDPQPLTGGPVLAVGGDGAVTVLWTRELPGGEELVASTRPAGGAFSPANSLSAPDEVASSPVAVVDDDDLLTVAWASAAGPDLSVKAIQAPTAGPSPAPVTLSFPHQVVSSPPVPRIALGFGGATTVVWSRPDLAGRIIEAVSTAHPPVLRVRPRVTGDGSLGSSVSCPTGEWSGAATVMHEWLRDGAVAGSVRVVTGADQGRTLACRSIARNRFGRVVADSEGLAVPPPPALLGAPHVAGIARVGRTLTCTGASFAGATGLRYAWRRGARTIARATRARYVLKVADRGRLVACRVIATGPGGTVTATSRGVRIR